MHPWKAPAGTSCVGQGSVLDSFPSWSCLLRAGNPDQGWISLECHSVFNGKAAESTQLGLLLDSISSYPSESILT